MTSAFLAPITGNGGGVVLVDGNGLLYGLLNPSSSESSPNNVLFGLAAGAFAYVGGFFASIKALGLNSSSSSLSSKSIVGLAVIVFFAI